MNDIINAIDLYNNDPNSFVYFYISVQDYMKPSITFHIDEVYDSLEVSRKHIAIYIIAYVDSKGIKRVMINEDSNINMVSIFSLQHFNILLSYLSAPTLAIKDFKKPCLLPWELL